MLSNERNFDNAFELAIKAFYGEGLTKFRSNEDIIIAENIIASNVDKIYMQPEWTAEVYEEVIRCYRILGLKVLEAWVSIGNESVDLGIPWVCIEVKSVGLRSALVSIGNKFVDL